MLQLRLIGMGDEKTPDSTAKVYFAKSLDGVFDSHTVMRNTGYGYADGNYGYGSRNVAK